MSACVSLVGILFLSGSVSLGDVFTLVVVVGSLILDSLNSYSQSEAQNLHAYPTFRWNSKLVPFMCTNHESHPLLTEF